MQMDEDVLGVPPKKEKAKKYTLHTGEVAEDDFGKWKKEGPLDDLSPAKPDRRRSSHKTRRPDAGVYVPKAKRQNMDKNSTPSSPVTSVGGASGSSKDSAYGAYSVECGVHDKSNSRSNRETRKSLARPGRTVMEVYVPRAKREQNMTAGKIPSEESVENWENDLIDINAVTKELDSQKSQEVKHKHQHKSRHTSDTKVKDDNNTDRRRSRSSQDQHRTPKHRSRSKESRDVALQDNGTLIISKVSEVPDGSKHHKHRHHRHKKHKHRSKSHDADQRPSDDEENFLNDSVAMEDGKNEENMEIANDHDFQSQDNIELTEQNVTNMESAEDCKKGAAMDIGNVTVTESSTNQVTSSNDKQTLMFAILDEEIETLQTKGNVENDTVMSSDKNNSSSGDSVSKVDGTHVLVDKCEIHVHVNELSMDKRLACEDLPNISSDIIATVHVTLLDMVDSLVYYAENPPDASFTYAPNADEGRTQPSADDPGTETDVETEVECILYNMVEATVFRLQEEESIQVNNDSYPHTSQSNTMFNCTAQRNGYLDGNGVFRYIVPPLRVLAAESISHEDSEVEADNTAVIDEQESKDSVAMETEIVDDDSWDAIYDEEGESLDPSLMQELTLAVGKVKIQKPKFDYLNYQPREPDIDYEDYSHLVEIYDFPENFQTRDIIASFRDYLDRGFDMKWVDDNHAIGIFASGFAARDALRMRHPLLKTRPLSEATSATKTKAKRSSEFLQPYKQRPETSAFAARRLVSGALGMQSRLPREKRDEERRKLVEVRERRKRESHARKAAWDGAYSSCAMDEEWGT